MPQSNRRETWIDAAYTSHHDDRRRIAPFRKTST
jgi:hypothetical protein